MSTTSIKITALALTFFACMNEQGNAEDHMDVFTGCVSDSQGCKNMCGDTYKVTLGHAIQKSKKCPSSEKPLACFCDYRTQE